MKIGENQQKLHVKHYLGFTALKVSKYGVIFGSNTGKYIPEITPYLDTFHAVLVLWCVKNRERDWYEIVKNVEQNFT